MIIMIISHQERILDIADKIVYLKDGKIVEYDDGKKVMEHLALAVRPPCCKAAALDRSLCGRGKEVK